MLGFRGYGKFYRSFSRKPYRNFPRNPSIQEQLVVVLRLELCRLKVMVLACSKLLGTLQANKNMPTFHTCSVVARRRYYTAFDAKEFRVGAQGMVNSERLFDS